MIKRQQSEQKGRIVRVINFNEFLKDCLPPKQTNNNEQKRNKVPIKLQSNKDQKKDKKVKNEDFINNRNLRTMIGFSSEAEQGFEEICETVYARQEIEKLKFSNMTPYKLREEVKEEVNKNSLSYFQNQNIHSRPSTVALVNTGTSSEFDRNTPIKSTRTPPFINNNLSGKKTLQFRPYKTEGNTFLKQKLSSSSSLVFGSGPTSANKISTKSSLAHMQQGSNIKTEEQWISNDENIPFMFLKQSEIPSQFVGYEINEKQTSSGERESIKQEEDKQRAFQSMISSLYQKISSRSKHQKELNQFQNNKIPNHLNFSKEDDQLKENNNAPQIRAQSQLSRRALQNKAKTVTSFHQFAANPIEQNKSENKIVQRFLRAKSIDSKNWTKIREKIYLTLKAKCFPEQDEQNNHSRGDQQGTSLNQIFSEVKSVEMNSPKQKDFILNLDLLKKNTSLTSEDLISQKSINLLKQSQSNPQSSKPGFFSARNFSSPSLVEEGSNQVEPYLKFSSRGEQPTSQNVPDYVSIKDRQKIFNETIFQNKVLLSQAGSEFRSQTALSSMRLNHSKTLSFQANQNTISQNPPKKPIHQMMNSLCYQQIKKIRVKSTQAQKDTFSQGCKNILSRNDFKYEKETPIDQIAPEYQLHKFNYIPRVNVDDENIKLKQVLKSQQPSQTKEQPHLSSLQQAIFKKLEREKNQLVEQVKDEFIKDIQIVKTDGKTVKERVQDTIRKEIEIQDKDSNFDELGVILSEQNRIALGKAMNIPNKWPKIIRSLYLFLDKANQFGLTLKEVYKEKLFARVPFGREGSKEFFSLVKNNEKQAVSLMLRRDKYLVYTYDYGMCTPLQWACKRKFFDVVEKLLEYKSDVDHINNANKCALEYSCELGDTQAVLLLIVFEANPWRDGKCILNRYLGQYPQLRYLFIRAKKIHFMMVFAKSPSIKLSIRKEFAYNMRRFKK